LFSKSPNGNATTSQNTREKKHGGHVPTLPAVVADAQLLAGEVAVAAVGAAAVVVAVGDVARLALPVLVALAVHVAGDGVARGALAVAGAVAGARVDAGRTDAETDNMHLLVWLSFVSVLLTKKIKRLSFLFLSCHFTFDNY